MTDLTRSWLDHWYQLLGDPSLPAFDGPDDMAGVLADLRRDPARLAEAFAPLPQADALLQRVRYCVAAESDHGGVYLVPDPVAATDAELVALTRDALSRGHHALGTPVPEPRIDVHRREMTSEEASTSAPLIEELGDFYIELAYGGTHPENLAMRFLGETLYTLAASFAVRGWVLTPLCPEAVQAHDPWRPMVELWRRGAQVALRWNDDEEWVDIFEA